MSDDVARLVYEGAVAVREGRRDDAQGFLLQAISRDERNELAWLWLSGAMNDPEDQQVALENVLAINPNNQAARQGLELLQTKQHKPQRSSSTTGEWVPPPPLDKDEVLELTCWQCGAGLYSVAQFCWQCHTPVHACNNCVFRPEPRCKELQGLTSTLAQAAVNNCPWWRPS